MPAMTITLTMKEDWELWAEANHNCPQPSEREPFESIRQMPNNLVNLFKELTKRMYLQGKVLELMTLQLGFISSILIIGMLLMF
ncbi:hypothetical protein KBT16_21755 [Nostoc sp. CCCryo 231-06]|nr:hypothetical protein [Nostoc sp. CCCryo 231-06]